MPDVEAVAAPSAAEVSTSEPIEIPRSGSPEYAEWRKTGAIPAKSSEAKPVEPPATDETKASTAVDPDPAPGTKQESRRKPDAEARIAELTAKAKQLERDLEEARKPKEAKADPPPARQPEVSSKPKPEDKNADGTPKYTAYEDYVEALADWKAEQRIATREREQAQAKQLQALTEKLTEARNRYGDYDSKAMPMVQELMQPDIAPEVFRRIEKSPVMADLLYVIGGTEESKKDFLDAARKDPDKAIDLIFFMSAEIKNELSGSSDSTQRNDKGQFIKAEEAPVKRGPESAPNPPIEIGNRGGIPKESDAADTGDFRAFKRAQDAKQLKTLRGA